MTYQEWRQKYTKTRSVPHLCLFLQNSMCFFSYTILLYHFCSNVQNRNRMQEKCLYLRTCYFSLRDFFCIFTHSRTQKTMLHCSIQRLPFVVSERDRVRYGTTFCTLYSFKLFKPLFNTSLWCSPTRTHNYREHPPTYDPGLVSFFP